MLSLLPASLVALFSLAATVAAFPAGGNPSHGIGPRAINRQCDNDPSPEDVSKMEELFAGLLAENQASNTVTPAAEGTVPVYFNVIYATQGDDSGGYVPSVIHPFSRPVFP